MRTIKEELRADSKEQLDEKVESYLQRYHPLGYDTRVDRTSNNPDTGEWIAVMSRWSSCD